MRWDRRPPVLMDAHASRFLANWIIQNPSDKTLGKWLSPPAAAIHPCSRATSKKFKHYDVARFVIEILVCLSYQSLKPPAKLLACLWWGH